jgi:hypothetical protein
MDERRTEFSELKRVCPTKTKTQPKMMRTKVAVVNLRTRKIVSISNLRQFMTKLAKDQYECIKFAPGRRIHHNSALVMKLELNLTE